MNFDEWLKEEYGDSLLTNRMRLSLKDVWDYQQKKIDCCSDENKAHLEKIDDALNTLCKLQYSSGERIYNDVGNILKGNKDD